MAVTRSTAADRQSAPPLIRPPNSRSFELVALVLASILAVAGILLTYTAKTSEMDAAKPLYLSEVSRAEQLQPLLQFLPSPRERQAAARQIYDLIQSNNGYLPNVGATGRLRVGEKPLLTQGQLARLKPMLAVRTLSDFRSQSVLWVVVVFVAFYAVHLFWRFQGFDGEQAILPIIHLLTGVGIALLIGLRDPLRDTLGFVDYAQSVAIACVVMAAVSVLDVSRMFSKLSFVPLIGALALSVALITFGTGPGVSDAKVNLFGVQPAEFIKILIVLFFAGYFAQRWEFLRVLKERRPELAKLARHVEIPRLEYVAPIVLAVGVLLLFFFLQKDLGPALLISCVFLALYAVARNRALLAGAGLALMLGGFLGGYFLEYPRTVYQRVDMWLSPWDNHVRGGDQVVQALWAMSSGGMFGAGLGLGDPELMPAAHTDLILAVLGEEWGWIGFAGVYVLYGVLIWLGLRIAMRARDDYSFFLALGFTLLIAFSTLLISGGVLDLSPLSGVVTPFLSYGGTAMIANFAIFGVLLGISRQHGVSDQTEPFRAPVRRLAQVLAVLAFVVVGKAAWIQIIRADVTTGAGTLTLQADGFRRYLYNPRIMTIARSIPRGTIYDRNGVPLATSDLEELKKHNIAQNADPDDSRHYPFGAYTTHLLGDTRTRSNWGARNSSYIERDSTVRLQGYDDRARVVEVPDPRTGKATYTIRHDYRELLPLLRHRYQPEHPDVVKVMTRERNVQTSIDSRLQVKASQILQNHLQRLKKQKGAVVVMDADSGDLLASVTYPWPAQMPPVLGPDDGIDEMLDRARYGLYPPGSTFKIVTATAALRADPNSASLTYECKGLPDGRVGNYVRGWGRPIRDDVADRSAHGNVNMQKGVVVSCNAYFAQLGTYKVGPEALHATANLFGISVASPNTPQKLKDALPQAAYGQGQVVASPFQMARVAATVANNGNMPYGRWITDESNPRIEPPQSILQPELARTLADYMRGVVTGGTGRNAAKAVVPMAGKTGTAELAKGASHAWFIGFAPFDLPGRRVAFAVLVENGQYGGSAAAPIAVDVIAAAHQLGLFTSAPPEGQQ
ncbi:MAG TPA: FtsW/RodA/SpoVE family cell cycle protein [Bryobacteraceae bacterium]|nr:FtsW/RodA/SpoVE family cell cycle protein [Bryobacteraceae bacterium]